VEGHDVELLDTPSFGDPMRSDTETLNSILAWFKLSDRKDTFLSGVIYLHRTTDKGIADEMRMNMILLKELIGEQSAENIMLVSPPRDRKPR